VFLSYFDALVLAVDVRDPFNPQEVAFIPKTTNNTDFRCATINAQQNCVNMIQTNNVATDDRGFIYIVDRANTGLHVLELEGDTKKIIRGEEIGKTGTRSGHRPVDFGSSRTLRKSKGARRSYEASVLIVGLVFALVLFNGTLALSWEPTKPIEFVIPAGTGGGADQMARLIGGIAEKHKLSPRPLIAVNKSGGAGAEGFLYVKGKKGDAYTIIITLSNLFTTPLHTGVPFNWKDLTPIARLALDQFILWVNAETPYKTAKEYIAAVKERSGGENRMKMGGTGSAQEDQILTIQLEQALGLKFTYVPFKGGGEVCVNLVGGHVDSTVNNPIECVSHWKAGRVRPLAVFDTARITVADWKGVPTIKEALGVDVHYLMLRGIFGAPDMPKDAVEWYIGFLKKVYDTPDFKKYLEEGALKPEFATGAEYVKWVEENEKLHRDLMAKGGLLNK
jgi:putative tricarboxylic transport membrane protein